jgi:hypothetical protein
VVSVKEKAGMTCQVGVRETNESEPLVMCRNIEGDVKTGKSRSPGISLGVTCLPTQAASGMKAA